MINEWKFEWSWCEHCDSAIILCPKCGNNTCNGGYGPAEGTIHDKDWDIDAQTKCPVCPLAYQYMELAYQVEVEPTKEQLEK